MPYGARAPKELLHHLPALMLRRPAVSAPPPGGGQRVRGSRLLDRRPPHYRCPAVPGFKMSTRAILMALGSSVLPSGTNYSPSGGLRTAGDANCSVACGSATLRQPAPLPVCSGWNPTAEPPGARARSRRLHRGATPLLHCRVLRTALTGTATAVLLTAAPDHCGPPGPVVSPVAVLQPLWLRYSTTAPSCELQLRVPLAGSSSLPGPVDLGYKRNHNHDTAQCLLRPP